ncbi:MAG: hydantoinase B/oxoprolinase family protein [Candidatus Bipolaricaulota bacterium]|nr:hydantoinase B/oxoprolinase family protein [Candidatus Bipolaricaulota bacterium]
MRLDPFALEVLRHALAGAAEEMNANLVRSAYSPNIKERRDCSSALFTPEGALVAQAESIPVHLGAMPFSVGAALAAVRDWAEGDVVVLNDPYLGGAHLPDVTFVAPAFFRGELLAFVACRAHHADIGGSSPGSLSPWARDVFGEGLRIPPVHLWRRGELDRELLALLLLNVRTPEERLGDLRAQHAACQTGIARLEELALRYGKELLSEGMREILDYGERRMRAALVRLPQGVAEFEDALDDDGLGSGPLPIRVRVELRGDRVRVDFAGSAPQARGPVNAPLAVTASAVYFALRAVADPTIPPSAGPYRPIEIHAPAGSIVNPRPPAPVVGGNLETSQRIVDVILGALAQLVPDRVPAAGQGTMNNVAIGGTDPRTGRPYAFYETIAGGAGARPDGDGPHGVHTGMTNTLNTPVEALELAYPLRVERYELRPGTGGKGRFHGGWGIRRDLTPLGHTAHASILSDRRVGRPYGLGGGEPGAPGENVLIRDGKEIPLPGKTELDLRPGEVLSIRTPGGGGHGPIERREKQT